MRAAWGSDDDLRAEFADDLDRCIAFYLADNSGLVNVLGAGSVTHA